MRHGQLSIEFILLMSMAIIVGVLFLASAADLFQRTSERQRIAALNDVGYRIQDELILATTVTDGYSRTFRVPDRADRFAYELTAIDGAVTLRSGPAAITYSLPPYTGAVHKGDNNVTRLGDEVTVE